MIYLNDCYIRVSQSFTTYFLCKKYLYTFAYENLQKTNYSANVDSLMVYPLQYEESSSQEMENNINVKTEASKDDSTATDTNSRLCQICYDKTIECVFFPCGHAKTCEECATRIKNSGKPCPYCRKSVSTTYRIYL